MTAELKELGFQLGQRRIGRLMLQNINTVVRTRKFKQITYTNIETFPVYNLGPEPKPWERSMAWVRLIACEILRAD